MGTRNQRHTIPCSQTAAATNHHIPMDTHRTRHIIAQWALRLCGIYQHSPDLACLEMEEMFDIMGQAGIFPAIYPNSAEMAAQPSNLITAPPHMVSTH